MNGAAWAGIGWVDWALLGLLAVSVVAGAVRGIVFEVLSLIGWGVGWFVAVHWGPVLSARLPLGEPGSAINLAAGYIACFLATIILWALGARLVRLLLHTTPLTAIDRVLGAGFGLARGALMLLVLAVLVALTPASQSQDWQQSRGAGWLQAAVQGIKPLLPAQTRRWLPDGPGPTV